MRSLLVTGATGFVGRNLLVRAQAEGVRLFAPVRNPRKLSATLGEDGIPQEAVTALGVDPDRWPSVAPSHAVLSAGVLFARTREEYFEVNVEWTLRVLRALPEDCRVVLLSSQSAGGPTPTGVPARRESDPDRPLTWYGESKLALERAVRAEFPQRAITILRPPMILGARDAAVLPLLRMARGLVRTKPGLRTKWFSFVGVEDVVEAVLAAPEAGGPYYLAAREPVSDRALIAAAAAAVGGRGATIPVPLWMVRLMAAAVDAVPAWRDAMPSLTRDRAREIWPDRWVVDASAFREATGWEAGVGLDAALRSAFRYLESSGRL